LCEPLANTRSEKVAWSLDLLIGTIGHHIYDLLIGTIGHHINDLLIGTIGHHTYDLLIGTIGTISTIFSLAPYLVLFQFFVCPGGI